MTLRVDLREDVGAARVSRDPGWEPDIWSELTRAAQDLDLGAHVQGDEIVLSWAAFLSLGRALAMLQQRHGFRTTYGPEALVRLQRYRDETLSVAASLAGEPSAAPISPEEVDTRLAARGWDLARRALTEPQQRDLAKLIGLANAANFSIPGAGKTTTALALNLLTQPAGSTLLIVAPKNAFPAWDEVIDDCLEPEAERFVRLVGGIGAIREALALNPNRAIIGYGQLIRVLEVVADFMRRRRVHLILDESHRIKAGQDTQTGQAALALSPWAARRDILTGTPMPNALADLAWQFEFLWPAQGIGARILQAETPGTIIKPFYARTVEHELNIPEAVVDYRAIAMSDAQRLLYGFLRDDLLRSLPGAGALLPPGMRTAVMRLLQAAIDPQAAVAAILQSSTMPRTNEDLFRLVCRRVMEEDVSPRFVAVEQYVRAVVGEGRKVVVWVPFRYTLDRLNDRLADLGALPIHGGIEAGDEDEPDTREWTLKQFHNDPDRRVLVSNPAAGGEGISLHRICQDAVYMGRTYNAAHYLQSRKRIHRLGLPEGAIPRMTIYESAAPQRFGSIDRSVRRRLDGKIAAMAAIFDDPELRAVSLESQTADPTLDDGLSLDDVLDLVRELQGQPANAFN